MSNCSFDSRNVELTNSFVRFLKNSFSVFDELFVEIGKKKTSAQLTKHYLPEELIGKQVAAVINFPPKQIGKMISEVLVLGFPDDDNNPVLVMPSKKISNGGKLF